MARKDRLDLVRSIERKRKSKLIVYVTSDRGGLPGSIAGDVVPVIERHARALSGSRTQKLDLFLYSRGGSADVPWSLVSMIRQFLGDRPFGVLVPFRAHSAATVIALGADEIVMTAMGELGPIDATIERGPHNPREHNTNQQLPISVEDTMGYFSLLKSVGLNNPSHKMEAFSLLANKVHPLALGSVKRLLSETQRVANALLKYRHEPLSDSVNEEIVKQFSSEIYSHQHTVRRDEALNLGLSFVRFANEDGIEEDMWGLFQHYAEIFKFDEPFNPNDEMIIHDEEEKEWKNMAIACVESTSRKDVFTLDFRVRQLRELPPTVNFSLPNLQLSIPEIPQGLDASLLEKFVNEKVGKMVETQIQAAAKKVAEELVRSLPKKGFEHVQLHASWKHDKSAS